ncbi:hypothetical protein ABZ383_00825 [Streptomyces sp. NPDC005900]
MSAASEARTQSATAATPAASVGAADQIAATIPISTIRASVRRR